MPAIKISKRTVDAAPVPVSADAYYWDTEVGGLGLRVTPRGVRSFVFQYRLKGRPARRLTIGKYGALTPDAAIKRAKELASIVVRGVDPVEQEKQRAREQKTLNFEGYVGRFVEGCLKQDWPDSWADAKRLLDTYAVPVLRGRSLLEISRAEIREVTEPLRDQKALARKVHAVLSRLFSWAVEEGDLASNSNPILGMKPPPKPKDRKRTLSPDELVAVWRASYKLNGPFGAFVRLLLVTLQRRNEVAGLPWRELKREASLWMLSGERAKNEQDHLVPLNRLAVAELEAMGWKGRGLVFSTTGTTPISGFSRLKAQLDRHMVAVLQELADERAKALGEDPHPVTLEPWRLHDLRRSGATTMQSLGVPVEHVEKVLNHKDGEASRGIRRVYNLHEYQAEKRKALDLWGEYLDRLTRGSEGSSIVSLARTA